MLFCIKATGGEQWVSSEEILEDLKTLKGYGIEEVTMDMEKFIELVESVKTFIPEEVEQYENIIEQLEEEIEVLEDEVSNLEDEVYDLEVDLANLQEEYELLEERVED